MIPKKIGQKGLANLLGITPRQIANLIDAGIPSNLEEGRRDYPLPEAVHWYINWKSKKGKDVDASSKALSERRLFAETRKAELELYELEGEMIRLDVHEKRVDDICARLSAALEVIPSKYLSRIQVARTDLEAQEVGEKIRDDTKGTLFAIADDLPDVTNETEQKNEGG